MTANSLRERKVTGPILGPLQASVPVTVYIGPARGDAVTTQLASTKRRKGGAATETAEAKPDEKPKTVNASAGFNLSPGIRPPGNTFAPAAAESKPAPAPSGAAAAEKPKQAAKKKPDAKKTAETKNAETEERRGEIHQAMSRNGRRPHGRVARLRRFR